MKIFSDSHCHLDWFENPQEIVENARNHGVCRILALSIAARNFEAIKNIAYLKNVFPAYGLHPLYQNEHREVHLNLLEKYSEHATAIGEIGLDYSDPQLDSNAMKYFFTAQLSIARNLHLPVLLHARKSLDDVLLLVRKAKIDSFVIHSFTGSNVQLKKIFDLGGLIGIGGTSTYPRAQRLRKQLANIPANRYLLETDAPDQPLLGMQGVDNKPENLTKIAENLAGLRQESIEQISADSEANAKKFFNW